MRKMATFFSLLWIFMIYISFFFIKHCFITFGNDYWQSFRNLLKNIHDFLNLVFQISGTFLFLLRLQGVTVVNLKELLKSVCSGVGKWSISVTSIAYCASTASRMSLTWRLRKDLKTCITVCHNLECCATWKTCTIIFSFTDLNSKYIIINE